MSNIKQFTKIYRARVGKNKCYPVGADLISEYVFAASQFDEMKLIFNNQNKLIYWFFPTGLG